MAYSSVSTAVVFGVLFLWAAPINGQDAQCPAAEDISPCVCKIDTHNHMEIDCSDVTSEDELTTIFAKEFPQNDFFSFMMQYNTKVTTLKAGTFADKTFKEIHFQSGHLEVVEAGACMGSQDTATKLDFRSNHLNTFPFDEIPLYTALIQLRLGGNQFETFPHISSPTLQQLDVHGHNFGVVPDGALSDLPNLEILFVYRAGLTEVPFETFAGTPKMRDIDISFNSLTSLEGLVMHGEDSYIIADHNDITSEGLSPTSFTGIKNYMSMWHNMVSVMDEATWRPLLEGGAKLDVTDNPLKCDCTIAWLVLNDALMAQLMYIPQCSNGTPLINLDPSLFDDC